MTLDEKDQKLGVALGASAGKVLRCRGCGYTRQPRVSNPKKCPRCGRRLDRPPRLPSQRSF